VFKSLKFRLVRLLKLYLANVGQILFFEKSNMLWSLVKIVLTLLALKLFMRVLNKIKISNYKGRYVLVTGCDSGFGYLLTKRLDLLGFNVFAGCLTKAGVENLRSECSEKVTAVQLDVSNDDNINAVAGLVKKKLKPDQGTILL
jgi:hypothetical protein